MQFDLSGLRALVTGSTKGIGRAIAETLAQNGAQVAVNGRKAADVEAAIAALRAAQPKAQLVPAPGDIATAEGVAAVIKGRRRGRPSGEQRRRLRAQAGVRDPGRGLAAAVRNQRALGRALHASLRAADAR